MWCVSLRHNMKSGQQEDESEQQNVKKSESSLVPVINEKLLELWGLTGTNLQASI